jgi:hypothetical protein
MVMKGNLLGKNINTMNSTETGREVALETTH